MAAAPLVSVIVPAHNGSLLLRRCLAALQASSYQPIELIVVDDSSHEPVAALAESFGARVVRLEGGPYGPAVARNAGAAMAQGELLFFTDADCEVHPDTVRRVVTALADPTLDAVIGSYDAEPAEPGFLSQYKNLFHHWVHQQASREATTFWSGCGGIRRAVFLALGGFDPAFRRPSIEDIELGVRLRARGGRIRLDPELQVRHLKRWTLLGLLQTEIFDRGAPWTALILRTRQLPADLNLRPSERVSAACAVLGTGGLLLAPLWWPLATLGVALLGVTLWLNRRFYRFFAQRRGLRFAVRVVPLHLLYYLYSAASILIGIGWYLRDLLWPRAAVATAPRLSLPSGEGARG
ncbi:MAG: hypothetical protein KatS3mg061_1815 [Dehalococcoidia bacterium]|nr:MAG: hypothetical protein KatS3mg061_1815 [Dehalococcoidia bacterium]